MKKEISKFFCAPITWKVVSHLSLGLNGVLLIALWYSINTIRIIIPAIISCILGYYAW